ncbi:MAG: FAD-dependent oxidoreductase [Candidatus Omnitrophota bacterium]|nr:FAD-dependent oxidoreductase [Candidatus Omnitrophota bacterium]
MLKKTAPEYFDVTVGSIHDFGNETKDFEFLFDAGREIRFIAGQFISVVLPRDGKVIRRAYSIASPPEEPRHLNLIIKRVEGGLVTNWFWTLKPGDRFQVHGPFGKFILPDPVDFEPLFIATGTGVAPFRSMIHSLLSAGFKGRMSLLFGARFETMIPYHEEFQELARRYPNFTYLPTVSRPTPAWKGASGYVQTQVEKLLANPAAVRVYICGLNEMIQPVQQVCLKAGLPKDRISYEKYD